MKRLAILMVAFIVVPLVGNDYWFTAILLPFLSLSLAAVGLNLLTGYAGQLSIGTSALFFTVGRVGIPSTSTMPFWRTCATPKASRIEPATT